MHKKVKENVQKIKELVDLRSEMNQYYTDRISLLVDEIERYEYKPKVRSNSVNGCKVPVYRKACRVCVDYGLKCPHTKRETIAPQETL